MGKYRALIKRLQASPEYEEQYQMRLRQIRAAGERHLIIIGRNELRLNVSTMKAILQDYLERQSYGDKPKVTDVTLVHEQGVPFFVVEVDGTVPKS